ncbi:MAG: response regulator transcription factor [Ruminiclostridium sp.]
MKKILIIEDDSAIAAIERDYLEIDNFIVEIAENGISGIEKAMTGNFQLILLDLMLPGADGFTVCRKLREHLDIPILMVTAKQEDIDKIRGLGLGADDYIVKPFSPSELVARVKANLAQYDRIKGGSQEPMAELTVGNIRINTKSHRVYVKDHELELKNKEYELLLFLVTNADMVFSKEALYERIWGYDALGDNATVAVHINRLREKIEEDSSNPQYIQTVWGAGYRFKV